MIKGEYINMKNKLEFREYITKKEKKKLKKKKIKKQKRKKKELDYELNKDSDKEYAKMIKHMPDDYNLEDDCIIEDINYDADNTIILLLREIGLKKTIKEFKKIKRLY
jgi:hypothetical protein